MKRIRKLEVKPISASALFPAARLGISPAFFLALFVAGASFGQNTEVAAARAQAAKGDPRAQNQLGQRYENGDDVSMNPAKAVTWYRKAAEQELPQAQYNLARMYVAGDGVKQDYGRAVNWLRKAAAHDYVLAKNRLGVMYEHGLGVPKDEVEAYKWYTLAAEANNIAGVANRDNLMPRLTSLQIAEAEVRAVAESSRTLTASRAH